MKQKTSDYSIFKKSEANRDVVELNVKKIMNSIQIRNLLEFRPIIVNSKMEVIDGQNRLEAAKRLGVEIWYEVQPDSEVEDIFLLNANQKAWEFQDYLKHYCARGSEDYLKLDLFCKSEKVNVRTALILLTGSSSGDIGVSFKAGKFIYPDAEAEQNARDIRSNIREIEFYLKTKTPGKCGFIKSSLFNRACLQFFSNKSVDFSIFMKKIPYRLDLLRTCSRLDQYMSVLKDIYNYKNREPVDF